MTIRNFNSIYSSKSTDIEHGDNGVNKVFEDQWDNRFEGLTLFNSQVSINKSLFVNAKMLANHLDVNGILNTKTLVVSEFTTLNGPSTFNETLTINGHVQENGVDVGDALNVNRGPSTFNDTLNVNCASTLTGALNVTGASTLTGSLDVTGASTLTGAVSCNNSLEVTGASTSSGLTLTVIGPAGVNGNLGVDGICNFETVVCNDSLEVTGASTTLRGSLDVTGVSTFNGAVSCVSTLGVTGAVTLSDALTVNGGSTLNNITGPGKALNVIGNGIDHALYVTGSTVVDGTLGVTGVCHLEGVVCQNSLEVTGASTTLRGSLDVTGVSTFNGAVECKSILKGPSEFIIDPSPFEDNDGTVIIKGNLTVQGNTTTVNSSNLDIKDVNITLAKESTSPVHSDGAGLTINLGADTTAATLLYESNQDNFLLNKQIRLNADPVDENDLARKNYVNKGENINNNSIGFEKLKGFKLKVITDSDVSDIDLTDIDLTVPCVLYVLNKKESLDPTSAMLGTYEFVLYPGFSMHVYDGTVWSSEL